MGLFDFLKGDKIVENVNIQKELEIKNIKWSSLGSDYGQFNQPRGIAIAPDGTVYVADSGNHRIQIFKGDGTLLRIWGSRGKGDGQFIEPCGIAISQDGAIYVADSGNHRIQMFKSDGTFVWKWGSEGAGDGKFQFPQAISIGPDGTIYVADERNHRIQVFTYDGIFLNKWGSWGYSGSGDGQFNYPAGIAVAQNGTIYITDEQNHRIQVFKSDGTFLRKWGLYGTGDSEFNQPRGIAVAQNGTIYVADRMNHRIQVFKSDGTFLRKWSSGSRGGDQFQYPLGIAIGQNGSVYVADSGNHCIKFLEEETKIQEDLKHNEDIRNKVLSLYDNGMSLTNEGRFEEAFICYKQALKLKPQNIQIKEKHDALMALTPEISIVFSQTSLAPNRWEQIDFTLTNSGRVTADNLSVSFSDVADVRKTENTYTVQAGESVTDTVSIKSDAHGRAPLDVTIRGRNFADREFETTSTIWLDISEPGTTSAPERASSAPLTSPPDPAGLFAKYQSYDLIGEGGFARVFRASRDGRTYAVKVPKTPDSATGKTFISEIQNWTRLNHPNIVRVFDYNILPTPYFEMEYCEESLDSLPKPMSPDQAAWLIYGVCTGLHYAHSQKIIHRDLKPQNILIREGIPKITDWGLSKVLTESKSTTSTSFTPYYAAPEQMGSQPKDERTDIWQLGAILYELVTGTVPFTGESMMEVMMGIMSQDPVKPTDLNPDAKELEPVILRCLEKDPAKRFASVTELQRVLAFYLKVTYTEALKVSQGSDDRKSAYLCGELLIIHLDSGELPKALLYGKDLIRYLSGENRGALESLVEQMSFCIDEGLTDLPEELMRKAEWIVHGSRLERMG